MGHRSRRGNHFAWQSKWCRYRDNEWHSSGLFQKEQELQTLELDMPAYLVIADSGVTGNTNKQSIMEHPAERIIDPTTNETGSDAVQSIGAIVQDTKTAIETKDPLKLGQLMTSNHDRLKNWGFSWYHWSTRRYGPRKPCTRGKSHRWWLRWLYDCPCSYRERRPSFTRTIHEKRSASGLDSVARQKGEEPMTTSIEWRVRIRISHSLNIGEKKIKSFHSDE